jgi:hypothetical protein
MDFVQRHKIFLLSISCLAIQFCAGQGTVSVKASADKDSILIGGQFHLSLEARFPQTDPMRFFSTDSISHFEILDRQKIDTQEADHFIVLKQVLTLTSFDTGHWVIPAFDLPGDSILSTDSLMMSVSFSPFDSTKDYHDIKDILDSPPVKKTPDWYWYAGASLVLLVIIFLLLKKKKKPVVKPVPKTDPYKEAIDGLEKLRREQPESKIFFTKLVDIFRVYVLHRKNIASMQKTSDDLLVQLKAIDLPLDMYNRLSQSMRMADFVKFAKYEPADSDRTEAMESVKKGIDTIESTTINRAGNAV